MSELHAEYIQYIKDFHSEAANIVDSKSRDYAGLDSPLRNFYDAATLAGVTVEQGLLVRMADKLARTRSLTERASLTGNVGEKLSDTLKDLSNYAAILAYFVELNYNSELVNQLTLPFEEEIPVVDTPEPSNVVEVVEEKKRSKMEELLGKMGFPIN